MPVGADIAELNVAPEDILRHAHALPAAPQVLGSLCELLEDVNTDVSQVAQQIRVDPALAARVLRLSSSVVFGGGTVAISIEDAVVRVGLAEITRVVGVATVAGLADRALPAYGLSAEQLRESLLMHALASEALADLALLDARMAYTGGLLRGVGMMVMDRVLRGRLAPNANFSTSGVPSYHEWERQRFGITCVEATAMILDDWHFPTELIDALERYLEWGADPLANVLHLAGGIAAVHGRGLPGEATCFAVTPEKLAAAGFDDTIWREVCARVGRQFERQRQALY